ncbi:MAG: hypothetical protein NC191_03320 [Muribaculaceae bacterium]|nr:hypothetical protein [Muribaculaceae bacterium]
MPFMGSISDKEIDSLESATQHVSDCYLMSTVETLSHTENGRQVLKNQIERDNANPNQLNCYFYSPNGEREKYTVPTDKAVDGYEYLYSVQDNEIIRSLDISVSEYEKKHKAKPWICRISEIFKKYKFENNLPSHFMETLTGVKPRVIAEQDFNWNLKSYKDEVMELFKQMEKEKNHSFVIGTGQKKFGGRRWHCYVIQDVDLANNTITVKEKRKNEPVTMDIDTALKTFKYIVGYFNSDLEKAVPKKTQSTESGKFLLQSDKFSKSFGAFLNRCK